MFDPKKFKVSNRPYSREVIFSGPVEGGYKLPLVKKSKHLFSNTYLVGYPDKKGCFSFREIDGRSVEIVLYNSNPKDVDGSEKDVCFHNLDLVPGWGFEAIRLLKEYLADSEEV